jgi:hypothetical protein
MLAVLASALADPVLAQQSYVARSEPAVHSLEKTDVNVHAMRDRLGPWSTIVAVGLVLATIPVVWTAFAFNLLKFGVTY